jgi:hypothetical protein
VTRARFSGLAWWARGDARSTASGAARPTAAGVKHRFGAGAPSRIDIAEIDELHPKVSQSGAGPARHGRTSKEGPAAARHVLVEAAWSAARGGGPLRAFALRVAAPRGRNVATVAVARKLAVLAWHLLTRGEDYAFARPSIVARKRRRSSSPPGRRAASPGRPGTPSGQTAPSTAPSAGSPSRAEAAYRRLVADWRASGPKRGAGATPGRAASRPSVRQAAQRTSKPQRSAL